MRSSWARWATCALAMSIAVPSLYQSSVARADHRRSLSDCTFFDQEDQEDDSVKFTIKNSCTIPVDCAMSWRVVCAPESKKRRNVHATSLKVTLESGASDSKQASPAQCGDDGWKIDSISWSCQPNPE